ncbi:MAG: ATP-binding protein [Bdellovibrionaceae bacterium]|nr:ATP-binding protein [Pseudobdellovibrionaceae bacterium]
MNTPNGDSVLLLAHATELMATATDYEATLECIARLLVSRLASWCTIDLITDEGKIERVAVAHRDPAKIELANQIMKRYPADPKAKRGVYAVIESGESIFIPEVPESVWIARADDAEHLRLIMALGSSSYMCVPLKARGRAVGAIMLLSGERTFTEDDLRTAEELARCIAMAVDNVHMFRKMKATVEELKATQDQLIHSEKLAGLGVLAAGIAHEVNNPLAIIAGHFEIIKGLLAKQEGSLQGQLNQSLTKVDKSIDRIAKIVRNVNDFSRQAKREFAKLELKSVVHSSLNLVDRPLSLSQIEVQTSLPKQPVYVLGELPCLEQVLINVFMNAIDAIKEKPGVKGGRLRVHLRRLRGHARLTIADNGAGIDPVVKSRVFEPFFTTKDVGVGTGLGLSISHGIIKDHGGTIDLVPREGNGAKIIIHLPLMQKPRAYSVNRNGPLR